MFVCGYKRKLFHLKKIRCSAVNGALKSLIFNCKTVHRNKYMNCNNFCLKITLLWHQKKIKFICGRCFLLPRFCLNIMKDYRNHVSYCFYVFCYMLGIVLIYLHHLIFTTTLWGRFIISNNQVRQLSKKRLITYPRSKS